MVTEFRQIVFSSRDLSEAISHFYRQKRPDLGGASIRNIRIARETPSPITVSMDIESDGRTESVTLESAFLAAAMLRHCFKLGIPISRHSRKNIELVGDNLALKLFINADRTAGEAQ